MFISDTVITSYNFNHFHFTAATFSRSLTAYLFFVISTHIMMRHEKLFYHHPISEEKILCRVLSSNWSIDITLLCRVNRRGTCVKLFMKGLKNFHLIPAGARRGHRCDQEDVEELQLESWNIFSGLGRDNRYLWVPMQSVNPFYKLFLAI